MVIQLQWKHILKEADAGMVTTSLPVSIGRAPGNDVLLTDRRAGVSRRHAQLVMEQGSLVLLDRQSSNGVFVGSQRVSRAALPDGGAFFVGLYHVKIQCQQRCHNATCKRLVDKDCQLCPWCGRFMADAQTREGIFGGRDG